MGRGRVELKRIENKIDRQVSFSKRRNGLAKKAYELSILCDAEVALIIFSNKGKLFQFCSNPSMLETLEKYRKCSYGAIQVRNPAMEFEQQSDYREYLELKTRCESLEQTQRNLLGEDLGPLNTKELDQLERQLESSLKHVSSTKTKHMIDLLSDLQNKEHMLIEANINLKRKLEEIDSRTQLRQKSWGNDHYHRAMLYGTQHAHETRGLTFQPLDCNPTLQTGYNVEEAQQMPEATQPHAQSVNCFILVGCNEKKT